MRQPHRIVTNIPVGVKRCNKPVKPTPVRLKNSSITGNWYNNTAPVRRSIRKLSTIRSVMTVPNDLPKEVLSWDFSMPQRMISPLRGMIRLEA